MAVSKNPLKAVDFSSVSIKAQPIKREKQQTYAQADWSGLGDNIAGVGDSVAAGYSKSKTKGPEGNTDVSKTDTEAFDKQYAAGKGKDQTNLQDRINTAKSQGKEDKVAKLEGKQERKDVRQKNKASQIEAVNRDKKKALTKSEFFEGQKFNEKQKKKGGSESTSHLFKPLSDLKSKGISIDPTISTISAPVLQKLGSTGKGFKLKAFRSN